MEKINLHSPDFTQANIAKLADLFPNCVTETRIADGTVKKAIDFDQLRQELSTSIVEGPQERYQLNWPGKREALLTANAPIAKTLRPCRTESVNFDTTQNLYIEGDNLDALKLLQETYLGKVKMIYIDPPYNTGSDFIYHDEFNIEKNLFDVQSGVKDEEGNRLTDQDPLRQNSESNGRFHSDWLSMMYPRLKLARNLLRDDGVIFISIDDNEQANLKRLCDEIFGEDNFLGCACRVSKKASNQGDYWSPSFDYALTYAKSRMNCQVFFGGVNYEAYNQIEKDGIYVGEKYQLIRLYMTSLDPLRGCSNQRYYIEAPDGTLLIPPGNIFPEIKKDGESIPPEAGDDKVWRWSKETYLKNKDKIVVKSVRSSNLVDSEGKSVKWNVFTKTYLRDVINNSTAKPNSLIEDHINQNSSHELNALGIPFSFAKPSSLVGYLAEISRFGKDDIILDFFSGSATAAHAVMQLNAEDGGKRKFIMVQIPEVCDEKSEAYKAGYKTIAEIGKERIRRAGKKIKADNANKEGIEPVDIGFRVLKIDSSNMKDIYYTPDLVNQDDLFNWVDNIREDRTAEDLLFQVLLDWGVDLTLPILKEIIAGKTVLFVDDNTLAACFDEAINEDFVKVLAARKPLRVVFRDAGFASDSVKINIEQIFKALSPGTEIKTL